MPVPKSYVDGLYETMKLNVPEFKRTPEEFKNLMSSDSSYRSNIYKALKDNYPEFTKTPDEFATAITPPVDYGKSVVDVRAKQDAVNTNKQVALSAKEQNMTAPGYVPQLPNPKQDEQFRKQQEDLDVAVDATAKGIGVDPKDFVQILSDVPGLNNPGDIRQLAQIKNENPPKYQRTIAATNWQNDLYGAIKQKETPEKADEIINEIHNSQLNQDVDFAGVRATTKHLVDLVHHYVDDEDKQQQIINNIKVDKANSYGGTVEGTNAVLDTDSRKAYGLNNNQILALNYEEDADPSQAEKYKKIMLDKTGLSDSEKLGYEKTARELDEKGANLRLTHLYEQISDLENKKQKQGGMLTGEDATTYNDLLTNYKSVQEYKANLYNGLNPAYKNLANWDKYTIAQDLVGQHSADFNRFLLKTGAATGDEVAGVTNLLASPFRSDESNYKAQLDALGEDTKNEGVTHLAPSNQPWNNYELHVSPEFDKELQEIRSDKSLSSEERIAKVMQLQNRMPYGAYKKPLDKPKQNFSGKAILYSMGDMGASLLPFIATEGVGGIAKVPKLVNTFTSALATGFQENYKAAIERGEPNPYINALRSTGVQAAFLAGVDAPGAIKKVFGDATAIGSSLKGLTDDEIKGLLTKKSPALKAFFNTIKDASNTSLKLGAANTGAQITNAVISGDKIDPVEMGKQFGIEYLKNTLMFGALGGVKGIVSGDFKNVQDPDKLMLFNAVTNPTETVNAIHEQVSKGDISREQGAQILNNIADAKEIYDNTEFVDGKGKPLSDKDARNVLWNNVKTAQIEGTLKRILPKKVEENLNIELAKTEADNDLIHEPKTEKQLIAEKASIEKQLEAKKENGEPELNDKDRVEAKGRLAAIDERLEKPKPKIRIAADQAEEINKKQLAEKNPPQPELQQGAVENTNTAPSLEDKRNDIEKKRDEELFNIGVYADKSHVDDNLDKIESLKTQIPALSKLEELAKNSTQEEYDNKFYQLSKDKEGWKPVIELSNAIPNRIKGKEVSLQSAEDLPIIRDYIERNIKSKELVEKYDAELKALEDESKKTAEIPNPKEEAGITDAGVDKVEQPAEVAEQQAAEPVVEPKEKIGVRHAETDALRIKRGIEEYQRTPETMDEWEAQADDKIKNGYDVEDLVDRMDKGYLPDKVEQRIMERYLNALDAQLEAHPTTENLAKLRRATQISDKVGGSEVAKSLSSRQNRNADNNTLGGFLLEKEEAQAHPLTETQLKEQTEKFNDLQKANAALQVELDKADAEVKKFKAERQLKKAPKSTVKKSHETYVKERSEIAKSIKEKWNKAGRDVLSSDIPFRKQLAAIAPDVLRLAKSLTLEGVDKLEDLIKSIHTVLKENDVEGVENKDILDILAGEHSEKKPTRNEKAETITNLRAEARLIKKIQEARKGEQPKTETKKIEKSRRIQELEDKLKEVRQYRKVKEAEDEGVSEVSDFKDEPTRAENLQKEYDRLNKRIAKLETDIREKNFGEDEPAIEIKLDAKARALQDRVIELEKQRKVEIERDRYERTAKWQKNWDKVVQALGIRRIVQTAVDLSVTLRQGVTVVGNPRNWINGVAGKAFMAQVRSVFNAKKFDRIMHTIRNSPDYHEMEKDGVVFNEIDMADPLKANEDFQKSWVYKLPYLKEPLLASNRAADAFLNVSRYELYQVKKRLLERQGITRENSPEDYKDMAKWVMNITGRGTLKEGMEKSGFVKRLLNNTFFGARLMASRFNILNPLYYRKMSKSAKVEAFKDMAGVTATLTATTLALMAAGGKSSLNPNDSEFMKVRFGNDVYDLTGGMGNYIRTYLRIIELVYSRGKQAAGTATKHEVGDDKKRALNSSGTFIRSKLAPNTSYVTGSVMGTDAIGQKFNPYDALKIYPMYIDDIKDAWKDEGITSLGTVLLPSIFGLGVQHYEPKDTPEDLPTLLDRNMRSDEQDNTKIMAYENGKERQITDSEFKKYIQVRDAKIKTGVENLYKNGSPETRDGKIVEVPYKDLTHDELVKELSAIKGKATTETKDELFPVPEEFQIKKEDLQGALQDYKLLKADSIANAPKK